MARNKRNSVKYDGKTFYEEQIPLLEKYNALLEERDRLEKSHVSSLGKQADILDEIERKTANANEIRKTGLNLSSEQTKDIIDQLNNQKKFNEEQERNNNTIIGGIKANVKKEVFASPKTLDWSSIGSDLVTFSAYRSNYKELKANNKNMTQEQLIKAAQEKTIKDLNQSADKFNLAANLMQGAANTIKDGIGIIGKLFKDGFNNITNTYESVAKGVAIRTDTTTSQQLNNIGKLNDNLGSWLGGSDSSLRDNIKSSDIIKYTETLANIGTGYSDTELYARALDDVITKTIVPYLDTGSVLWQQLVDYQPDLQKNIRGINKINQEIAGNNYATEKILNNILTDLAPVSEVATGDLAMNAADASSAINTIMGEYGMSEDQAISYYKQWYKQKYQGATVLDNGSVADKFAYINNLKNGVNLNSVSATVEANVKSDQTIGQLFGTSYDTNEDSLKSSYVDQAIYGGDTSKSIYYSASGKGYNQDFSDISKNGQNAVKGLTDATNTVYKALTSGSYQTTKDKQETYMENMTNDVAKIYSKMGYWGDLIVSAIKNLGTVLIGWGTTKLIGGVIGQSAGLLGGASVGGSGAGLMSGLGIAGSVGLTVGLTTAALIGIGKAAQGDYEGIKDREANNAAEELSKSDNPDLKKWANNSAMTSAYGGVAASEQQSWFGRTMSNVGGGFSTAWKNMTSDDYIAKNKAFFKWMEDSGAFSKDSTSGFIQRLAMYYLYDKAESLNSLDGSVSKSDLEQIAQEGYNLKSIQSAAEALVKAGWAPSNKYRQKVTADIDFASYGAPEGSYRQGLDEVPYDNYPALLHEGEAVLTASTADQLRGLLDEYRTTNNQSISFDTIIQEQTTALITKLDQLINVVQTNNTTSNISKASSLSNNMAYNMMRIKNLATFNNR